MAITCRKLINTYTIKNTTLASVYFSSAKANILKQAFLIGQGFYNKVGNNIHSDIKFEMSVQHYRLFDNWGWWEASFTFDNRFVLR